jgi:hypothetical protein
LILLAGCKAFDDADITERKTFVHFYSSATSYVGNVAELDSDGGYILSGEVRYENGDTDALVIKTDARGHKVWEKVIRKGKIKAIRPTGNGYILAGDSIHLDPLSNDVNELVNSYARVLVMDTQGNTLQQHISTDSISKSIDGESTTLTVDYHADALTFDQNGNIVVLGSFRVPGENEASYVSAFDPANISDSLWLRSYRSLEHDLINCHALHLTTSSSLVWASNTYTQQQNVTREYLNVSYVNPNSAFKNSSVFGESDDRNHSVKDIQKSGVGYGAIGTYSETSGLNGNMFFVRIDDNLSIVPGSEKYVDGEDILLNDNILDGTSKILSNSFDEGLALAATSDGFVLAGAMTSTPFVGNGGKDILLVKLDPFGNLLWKKLLGGSGDEVISSIRETPDKGLLLFGTNTINGLSSLMLIKTDEHGEIKD